MTVYSDGSIEIEVDGKMYRIHNDGVEPVPDVDSDVVCPNCGHTGSNVIRNEVVNPRIYPFDQGRKGRISVTSLLGKEIMAAVSVELNDEDSRVCHNCTTTH